MDASDMTLDELLRGDECEIEAWLSERGLVHECDCGYTVYDPWDVNAAVQEEWGDERCDEIHDWACNLSNQFGWLFLEASNPECDIYHCQHCAESEWSLLLDMERVADKARGQRRTEGGNEKTRGIKAAAYYEGKQPAPEELAEVTSESAVEQSVGNAANELASTLAGCIACYVTGRGSSATVILDPIAAETDQPLLDALHDFLPMIPLDMPHIRHSGAVVTLPPDRNAERLGDRVKCEVGPPSEDSPGLQLADFFAGDIRTFFTETPEVLTDALSSKPLVNKRLLFPQLYHVNRVTPATMAKLRQRTGESFLPLYRHIVAGNVISCCTANGQMRHIHLQTGEVFDLID